jgi:hypothetical protein
VPKPLDVICWSTAISHHNKIIKQLIVILKIYEAHYLTLTAETNPTKKEKTYTTVFQYH